MVLLHPNDASLPQGICLGKTKKFAVLGVVRGGTKKSKGNSPGGVSEDLRLEVPYFDVSKLKKSELNVNERFELCMSVGEECVQGKSTVRVRRRRVLGVVKTPIHRGIPRKYKTLLITKMVCQKMSF